MSATTKRQDQTQDSKDGERARLELRKRVIDDMQRELTAERRRVENTLRAMSGLRELSEAEIANSILASSVPVDRPERPLPRRGNGASTILDLLAEHAVERRRAAKEARAAEEAKKILPPWHGTPAPKQAPRNVQEAATQAGAEAMARITAEMAAQLMQLLARVVGWALKPPPFATEARPEAAPAPGAHPTHYPNWEF